MNQSTKAALLSGLVYPGLGQLALGRIYSGTTFIALSTIGFVVLIYRLSKRVYLILDQIIPMLAEDALDFRKIMELSSQTSYSGWNVETLALLLVICCWLVSVVHAYYLGKRLDRSQ